MRYLITTNTEPPFLSYRYEPENDFNADIGMVVYDLIKLLYTTDGVTWIEIDEDLF